MTEGEHNLIIKRIGPRWGFAFFFILGVFCSLFLLWTITLDIYNSTHSFKKDFILTFLLIVFAPVTFYNGKMLFADRFIFEINESGIQSNKGSVFEWQSIHAIEINKFPRQGLRTLYYLIGPKGLHFYNIVIYHDFLLKNKTKISFSSHINFDIEKIEDSLINYSVRHNIDIR